MPARPDAGAMVLLQSVDGDGFCVYRMVGRTIAGIARYPQPVSSLGHGADRPRGACAQSGIARDGGRDNSGAPVRSEEHTSELQSLMRISYSVFCLKKKT